MRKTTILLGDRTNSDVRAWSARLRTDDDLDSFSTAIEAVLEGQSVTILLKPDNSWRQSYAMTMLDRGPLKLESVPNLGHAVRHGRIVRGKLPAKNRRLEAFVLYGIVGEGYEVVSTHSDYDERYHEKLDERLASACSLDSYIGHADSRTYFFSDLSDATMFKLKWG